jgi:HAE1 family hydrophobic/amphiphilic exporter-1
MLVALSSPGGSYDATFLANYAHINLNDQLTRVPGIANVTVFGAGQYAMRLWVRPDQLAKLNITVPEIVDAIKKPMFACARPGSWVFTHRAGYPAFK